MGRKCRAHEKRNLYWILDGLPQVKRPSGRFRLMREDNIKIDFKEIVWNG
jgi:hypothetical protein